MKNPFLRQDNANASFLPQDYIARKNEMRANLICLGLFGIVMFGVIGAFFVTNRQWLYVQSQQKAVTVMYTQEGAKIEQFKRLEAQKSEMMGKAEVTTALLEKVPRSKLMSELVTRMPKDITLLEINLVSKRLKDAPAPAAPAAPQGKVTAGQIKTLGGKAASRVAGPKGVPAKEDEKSERITAPRFEFTIKLVGFARVNTNVADYIQSLKACALLENVDLKYIKEETFEKLELRKFEIEATIRADADARGMVVPDLRKAAVGGLPGADPSRSGSAAPGGKDAVSVSNVAEGEE